MTGERWRPSAVLLAISGLLVSGIGLYFLFIRPPLLPEDIRFMEFTAAETASLGTRLAPWLANVFHVLGGYALATGILTTTLAASSFRSRRPVAVLGASLAGTVSIGLMAMVNFAISSDFRWVLAVFAVVWASSLVAFVFEVPLDPTRKLTASSRKGNLK